MSDSEDTTNVYRALGRIEGAQTEILGKIADMVNALVEHTRADDRHFSAINAAMTKKADEQDAKIEALEKDANRAKGAGWVILGLLGALATFVGGAVIAVLKGDINFKLH